MANSSVTPISSQPSHGSVCCHSVVGSISHLTDTWLRVYVPSSYSIFTRQRYDPRNFKNLRRKVMQRLFTYLNSPFVVSPSNFTKIHERKFPWGPYSEVAVQCLVLRDQGHYKDASKLEQLGERLQKLNSCEIENALHFILLLSGTGPSPSRDDSPARLENYSKTYKTKYAESWFREDDVYVFGQELKFSEEDRNKEIEMLNLLNRSPEVNGMINEENGYSNKSVFWLESGFESHHSHETRTTLFSALTNSRTTHLDVMLQLPELPDDPYETSLAHPAQKLVEVMSEDEGFLETGASSSSSSDMETLSQDQEEAVHRLLSLSVWDEALLLPSKRVQCWEQFGRYDTRLDRFFLCEQGAKAFDSLCNTRMKEVQILTGVHQGFHMIPLKLLSRHVKNVLLGLPSVAFPFDRKTFSFTPNPSIRTSGLSPESLQNLLERFAVAGSTYQRLNKFAKHHSKNRIEMSGGLTLQAFIRGLEEYLYTYKESIVSVEGLENLSLMKIWAMFDRQMVQMQVLADICLCSMAFNRPKNMPKPKFPTGLRLLSYLYELCAKNHSGSNYYMFLHLLKVTSAPFIRFVRDWLFSGFCNDPYGEFLIDVDDQFLFFRDKHYWTHGFRLKMTQDNPPLFMGELAEDFFVCGKGINLLRLTCPKHYLFECKVEPPEFKLNFSMSHLDSVEDNSNTFCQQIFAFAEKRRRENLEMAVEQEIEKGARLARRRLKTEELLRRVKEMEAQVKEAIVEKKKQELKTLKEEMEKAVEARLTKRQKDREEDAKFMLEAEMMDKESDERAKRAREELVAYYNKLWQEAERRERKALWLIARYQLRDKRMEFLKQDEANVEMEQNEEQDKVDARSEKEGTVRKLAMRWKERRQILRARRDEFFKGSSRVTNSDETPKEGLSENMNKTNSIVSEEKSTRLLGDLIDEFKPSKTEDLADTTDAPIPTERIAVGQGHLDQLVEDFANSHDNVAYIKDMHIGRLHEHSPAKKLLCPSALSPAENLHPKSRFLATPVGEGSGTKALLYPNSEHAVESSSKVPYGDATPSDLVYVSRFQSTPHEDGRSAKDLLYGPSEVGDKSPAALIKLNAETPYLVSTSADSPPLVQTASGTSCEIATSALLNDFSRFRSTPNAEGQSAKEAIYSQNISEYKESDTLVLSANKNKESEPTVETALRMIYEESSSQPTKLTNFTRFRSTPQDEGLSAKEALYPQGSTGDIENLAINTNTSAEVGESLRTPFGDKGTIKNILYPEIDEPSSTMGNANSFIGFHRENLEPESKVKALLYPEVKRDDKPVEIINRSLTAEEIWLDLSVTPLRDSYAELEKDPDPYLYSNYIKSTTGIQSDDVDGLAVDAVENLPLEVIVERSLTIPIRAQTTLVNRAVVDYFMEDLQIRSHFEAFRKFLLLEDGEFGFALCNELFEKVASGILPRQLCTSQSMNQILTKALNQSLSATKVEFSKQLTFALKWLPDIFSATDINALDFLELRYKVPWPCNIVVTETCISKYNKVFSFLLQLKKVNWVLQDVFRNLKRAGQDRQAASSPQLRQLQLFRHEMQHFVNNVERYLVNQILDISWQEFLLDLKTNVHNLDDIHRCHLDYLKNIIFRSLLTKNATGVLDIITSIFSMILQFHAQLLSGTWRLNATSGHKAHPSFSIMRSTHTSFKQYAGFLFTVVSKLVQRGYQSHLDDFLLQVDFNGFYSSGDTQQPKKH